VLTEKTNHPSAPIAVKGYFDGSCGQRGRLTLAGYVASPETWQRFAQEWANVITGFAPPCKYLHMVEAHALSGDFRVANGWTTSRVNDLLNQLIHSCFLPFSFNEPEDTCLLSVCCTLDLDAWESACQREPGLEQHGQAGVCARFAAEVALRRLPQAPGQPEGQRHGTVELVFDQGERFKRQIEMAWQQALSRPVGRRGPLSLVSQISEADMRQTPGLQAADFLAWHINRWRTHQSQTAWWRTFKSGPGAGIAREFSSDLLVAWYNVGFDGRYLVL
jgi:Protein of unknown function (DUF3800)